MNKVYYQILMWNPDGHLEVHSTHKTKEEAEEEFARIDLMYPDVPLTIRQSVEVDRRGVQ